MRFFLTIILILTGSGLTLAQEKPCKITFLEGQYKSRSEYAVRLDSAGFRQQVLSIKNKLFSDGYLLANIDDLVFADTLQANIFVGTKYYWHALGINDVPQEFLSKAGYQLRDFTDTSVSPKDFSRLVNRLLNQAVNNGHPFAHFQLVEIEVNDDSIRGNLQYLSGPLIKYDSLTVSPSNIVKAKYLESYLNIRTGELFSIKSIDRIEENLKRLPFCQLEDSLQIKFDNNLSNVSLKLSKKKSNKFDAVIGFLPNQKKNGGLRLTGFVDLHLENLFRAGKSMTFQWQQFNNASQKLFLNYNHPNLFHSQIGFEFDLNLLKQDTLFLNTDFSFNAFYNKNDLEVAFLTDFKSSRKLSNPQDTLSLPEINDFSINLFGLRIIYDNIRNEVNPGSGFRSQLSVSMGGKQVKKIASLPENLYDSVQLKSTQLELNLGTEFIASIYGPLVLDIEIQLGTVYNSDRLFTNDLIRLGGINTLRGFNDLELYVSSYGLARTELRLRMDESSRVFLFYDQAFTRNSVWNSSDSPLGIGAGLYLRTLGGDLQLVYALGLSQQQSLSLSQSKIHIGYVANF